jgi:hypothetical protein
MDATGLWAQKLDCFKDQELDNDQGWPALIQEKLQEDSDYFEDTENEYVPVDVYAKYSGVGSEYITPLYEEHCQQAEGKTSSFQPATCLEQDSVLTAFLSELRGTEEGPWFAEELEEEYARWFSNTHSDDGYYFINSTDISNKADELYVLHAGIGQPQVSSGTTPVVASKLQLPNKSTLAAEKKKGKKYKPVGKKI